MTSEDTKSLAVKIENCTYVIEAYELDEKYSTGSGFAISRYGHLMTAAHVITNRLPVRPKDLNDPNVSIRAKKRGGEWISYKVGVCGPSIKLEYFREPLTVDIAILHPTVTNDDVPFLEICDEKPVIGENILMGGYPDEIELPFAFDRLFDFQHPQIKMVEQQFRKGLEAARQLLMIKSGMVGAVSGFDFTDMSTHSRLEGEILYIDNVMHSGASGGPVINSRGAALGIITQRAVTSISTWEKSIEEGKKLKSFNTPSGSGVAVTTRTMRPFLTGIV